MKKYWKSLEQYHNEGQNLPQEHPDYQELSMIEMLADAQNHKKASRRDFLKWCGISFVTSAVVTACENPVKKAIPYLHQPQELTPGMASYYASAWYDGSQFNSILVKTREGRPIKIEGNPHSSLSQGGTSARAQAAILGLYDQAARYKKPMLKQQEAAWEEALGQIKEKLLEMKAAGKNTVVLTPSILSPSAKALLQEFSAEKGLKHVVYDPISYSAIREAHQHDFKMNVIPDYRFDKAKVVVSFGADFLGTWLNPVLFAHRFALTRKPTEEKPEMSKLIQLEAGMSLTGSNADERIPIRPSQQGILLTALYNELARLSNRSVLAAPAPPIDIKHIARELFENKGQSLVISGSNNTDIQTLVNAINSMLGNYGQTIDLNTSLQLFQGKDAEVSDFMKQLAEGQIHGVVLVDTNLIYSAPAGVNAEEAIKKLELSVGIFNSINPTAEACQWILPQSHYLEAWNDFEPVNHKFALAQPCIRNLFDTKSIHAILLGLLGRSENDMEYLKAYWEKHIFSLQKEELIFNSFWKGSLQKGVFEPQMPMPSVPAWSSARLTEAVRNLQVQINETRPEVELYESVALGCGAHANNPWLQELPDPVTKVCWDNFAALSVQYAQEAGLKDGDLISIDGTVLPVLVQPGQAYGSISVALGYGHQNTGKVANDIGVNVFRLSTFDKGNRNYVYIASAIEMQAGKHELARTQTHHDMEGRAIVREGSLEAYKESPYAGNEIRKYHKKHMTTLYPALEFEGHHWAMAIDLNACTGCSSCVIACQAENNVPVVGKKEVFRRRIMHWIRIDRYYKGEADNPSVVYQPLMCQHCDHAPCENVCPVAATTHSDEGINQITYNRCVGTKYCINNCPYKVRRFNWFRYAKNQEFDYNMNDDMGSMVLNPDVTVRERGVVEKCSFCVQRIQEKKLKAKLEGRLLKDGEIRPACLDACPSGAIVFGDLNDPDSQISRLYKDPRNYHLLEELHTLPTVGYLTKISNKPQDKV